MKKFSLLILSAIFCLNAQGQDSKFLIGLELTPTLTSLRGNSMVKEMDNKFGFSAGLTINYFISPVLSLKSGLAFERKGAKDKITLIDETMQPAGIMDMTVNFDYLVLPVMISYSTKGKTKLYVNAGPYLGILISHKTYYDAVAEYPELNINYTDYTKRIDPGLSAGVGLYIPISNNLILDFGVRENLGLLNTSKSKTFDGGSVKVNSLGVQVGLKYKPGKRDRQASNEKLPK